MPIDELVRLSTGEILVVKPATQKSAQQLVPFQDEALAWFWSTVWRHKGFYIESMLAAVVAMPDPKWGEVPCGFVELKPQGQVTEADLIEFCRGLLARFKVPKRIVFGVLPKTSTGKIQKFVLREQLKSSSAIE